MNTLVLSLLGSSPFPKRAQCTSNCTSKEREEREAHALGTVRRIRGSPPFTHPDTVVEIGIEKETKPAHVRDELAHPATFAITHTVGGNRSRVMVMRGNLNQN